MIPVGRKANKARSIIGTTASTHGKLNGEVEIRVRGMEAEMKTR